MRANEWRYETANGLRGLPPSSAAILRKLQTATHCERCRRAGRPAVGIGGRALCRSCAGMAPIPRPIPRATSTPASSRAADDPRRVVGLLLPFEAQVRIGHQDYEDEVVHRGAFAPRLVPLKDGHDGPQIGEVRTVEYPDGLYFEGTLITASTRLLPAVSIGFNTLRKRLDTQPNGRRLRHVDVGWIDHIALVPQGQAAYPTTWIARASADAYRRMTEVMRARLAAA
jgi:hypothetical protein